MKQKKQIFFTLILSMCIVLTACGNDNSNLMPSTTHEATASPEGSAQISSGTSPVSTSAATASSVTASDASQSTTAKISSAPTQSAATVDYSVYDSLIAEWKAAFNDFKSGDYSYDGLLNFSFYSYDAGPVEAYYALYDIDGNGIQELILNERNIYEDIIAYIFTIKDSKPINLFGLNHDGKPSEVPWSRIGSSTILANGLIDSTDGDWSIYKIANDGYNIVKFASAVPYDYPDMAHLADAEWRYYIGDTEVEYGYYVQYLDEHGYQVASVNTQAVIFWQNII